MLLRHFYFCCFSIFLWMGCSPVWAETSLKSLAINGPDVVADNDYINFSTIAIWEDGSTSQVLSDWSEDSSFATIDVSGVLKSSNVDGTEAVLITARYTYRGKVFLAQKTIAILEDVPFLLESPDFDNDGQTDLLWRNVSDGRNILWTVDSGERKSASLINSVTDPSWYLAGVADFDGDNKSDILWRNQIDGRNLLWFMSGGIRLGQALMPTNISPNYRVAATNDFDGDGKGDILWRNDQSGGNIFWFMDGAMRKDAKLTFSVTDPNLFLAAADDFDGDGKTDLLWRDGTNGRNIVWLMNGAARKRATLSNSVTDMAWGLAGSGDFNGDGKADLLWRNTHDGRNLMWYMNGGLRIGQALAATKSNADSRVGGIGDYDGDFNADILWRMNDGRNIFWLMNGAYRSDAKLSYSVVDENWALIGDRGLSGSVPESIFIVGIWDYNGSYTDGACQEKEYGIFQVDRTGTTVSYNINSTDGLGSNCTFTGPYSAQAQSGGFVTSYLDTEGIRSLLKALNPGYSSATIGILSTDSFQVQVSFNGIPRTLTFYSR